MQWTLGCLVLFTSLLPLTQTPPVGHKEYCPKYIPESIPEKHEWHEQAADTCPGRFNEYHCVQNSSGVYKGCAKPIKCGKGERPELNRNLTGVRCTPCSNNRFEDDKNWSNEISDCTKTRTPCKSEYHLISCSNGSASQDRTCRCDVENNYVLDMRGKEHYCISPYHAILDCYPSNCSNSTLELRKDYKCVLPCPEGTEWQDDENGTWFCTSVSTESTKDVPSSETFTTPTINVSTQSTVKPGTEMGDDNGIPRWLLGLIVSCCILAVICGIAFYKWQVRQANRRLGLVFLRRWRRNRQNRQRSGQNGPGQQNGAGIEEGIELRPVGQAQGQQNGAGIEEEIELGLAGQAQGGQNEGPEERSPLVETEQQSPDASGDSEEESCV